jgi:hypothetical protein
MSTPLITPLSGERRGGAAWCNCTDDDLAQAAEWASRCVVGLAHRLGRRRAQHGRQQQREQRDQRVNIERKRREGDDRNRCGG